MSDQTAPMRILEFARRTGVTVRALHHYDRLGLLRPRHRTPSGYRLYGEAELVRLQQIVTLKFIGCPLKQIRTILAGSAAGLGNALEMQRNALQHQRQTLERALRAVERAQQLFAASGRIEWEAVKYIIEVIQMDQNKEWAMSYFTPEQQKNLASREQAEIAQGEQGWASLIPRIEAAASSGLDPASAEARKLVEEHKALIGMFTGGNPGINEGLQKLYADKANWPTTFKSPFSEKAQGFLKAVETAHGICRA
jgi:DNA-binding transcriptional MerR regulator